MLLRRWMYMIQLLPHTRNRTTGILNASPYVFQHVVEWRENMFILSPGGGIYSTKKNPPWATT
jgi:hypothetical protein